MQELFATKTSNKCAFPTIPIVMDSGLDFFFFQFKTNIQLSSCSLGPLFQELRQEKWRTVLRRILILTLSSQEGKGRVNFPFLHILFLLVVHNCFGD